MNSKTVKYLNEMNQKFYATTARDFHDTRRIAWQGWQAILQHIPQTQPLRVLDVGCGNARFAVFLSQNITVPIVYHGIDNNAHLLRYAENNLHPLPNVQFELTQHDILQPLPMTKTWDVVGVFGVLHHIPGAANRLAFVQSLAAQVSDGGILAFACWRFMDNERLKKKVVSWDDTIEREVGDYILDWKRGEHALRYCHFVDDVEHAKLVTTSGLSELVSYRADGADNQSNRYSILQQNP